MRHRRSRHRLKQKPGHARMFKRNLLTSLLLYESVRTTKKRAAVVAPEVDKLINYAKTHSPHVAIRYLNKTVTDKNASKKVMEVFIKRYAKKSSGLTRTVHAGVRVGDGAELVDLSLVEGLEGTEVTKGTEVKETSAPSETSDTSAPSKKKPSTKKSPAKKK